MRIELNAGGLGAAVSVASFGIHYGKMISQTQNVIKAFKAVESNVRNMNGGVGNLQGALESLERRITNTDEKRQQKMEQVGQKFSEFIQNTVRTDSQVRAKIALSNLSFALKNPWSIVRNKKAASFLDKAKQIIRDGVKWLQKKGEQVVAGLKYVGGKLRKAWESTKAFVKKHWKGIVKIVAGVVIIAGLFAISVAAGPGAPLILGLAAKGALTSALVGVAGSVVAGVVQGKSAGDIFDDASGEFLKGSIIGAITAPLAHAAGGVGAMARAAGKSKAFSIAAQMGAKGFENVISETLSKGYDFFKENGTLKGFFKEHAGSILKDFVIGATLEGISIGGDALKHKFLNKVDGIINKGANSGKSNFIQKFIHEKAAEKPWFMDKQSAVNKIVENKLNDVVDNVWAFKKDFKGELGKALYKDYRNDAVKKIAKDVFKKGFKTSVIKGFTAYNEKTGKIAEFVMKPFETSLNYVFDNLKLNLTASISIPTVNVNVSAAFGT